MRDLEDLNNNPMGSNELRGYIEEFMNYMFTLSQENIINNGTTDRGALLASGNPPEWKNNNKMEFDYDAPHTDDIEYGTDPHEVSFETIHSWVQRKLNIHGKESKSVALDIVNKIRKQGTDPQPFIRPAICSGIFRYNLKIKPPTY